MGCEIEAKLECPALPTLQRSAIFQRCKIVICSLLNEILQRSFSFQRCKFCNMGCKIEAKLERPALQT